MIEGPEPGSNSWIPPGQLSYCISCFTIFMVCLVAAHCLQGHCLPQWQESLHAFVGIVNNADMLATMTKLHM